MSNLNFVAAIVDSLVWPAFVAWLIYGFRIPIHTLLERLSSLKYKGLEAEFEKRIAEIQATPDLASAQLTDTADRQPTIGLIELSEIAPRAAVSEAWNQIEKATREYLDSIGIERRKSYQGLCRLPDRHKVPLEEILPIYKELRELRTLAAHAQDSEITADGAKQYVDMALWVVAKIRLAIQ